MNDWLFLNDSQEVLSLNLDLKVYNKLCIFTVLHPLLQHAIIRLFLCKLLNNPQLSTNKKTNKDSLFQKLISDQQQQHALMFSGQKYNTKIFSVHVRTIHGSLKSLLFKGQEISIHPCPIFGMQICVQISAGDNRIILNNISACSP